MKLIIAIIQPDKLDEVHQALIAAEIFRITVSRVTGHGQQEDPELYRGEEVVPGGHRLLGHRVGEDGLGLLERERHHGDPGLMPDSLPRVASAAS